MLPRVFVIWLFFLILVGTPFAAYAERVRLHSAIYDGKGVDYHVDKKTIAIPENLMSLDQQPLSHPISFYFDIAKANLRKSRGIKEEMRLVNVGFSVARWQSDGPPPSIGKITPNPNALWIVTMWIGRADHLMDRRFDPHVVMLLDGTVAEANFVTAPAK